MTRPADWRSPYQSNRRGTVERECVTWRVMLAARRAIRRVRRGAAAEALRLRKADGRDRHERRALSIELDAVRVIVRTDERAVMLELMRHWGLRSS